MQDENIENTDIGQKLQKYRETKKVTQLEVAKFCGTTKNHISALERGLNKCNIQILLGYCRLLNITPNDILDIENTKIIPELKVALSAMTREQQLKILKIIKALI